MARAKVTERRDPDERMTRWLAQRRAIWALAYVVVLLVVLALVPIITASRAQVHRRLIADTIEPARIAAGELEAYSLEQLLARAPRVDAAPSPPRRTRRGGGPTGIRRQWATLDSAAAMLGGEAPARIAALRRAMPSAGGGVDDASPSAAAALQTMTAAAALQEWLDARVAQERTEAVDVERWNVWLPVLIVPLALLGVVALVIAGRQVVTLGRVAQESAIALASATEAKAALLRGVTHDLKNPLGAAQGFTELMIAGFLGELTERSREAVGRVHRLLGDAIGILQDLTELARADSGELTILSVPTSLVRIIDECVTDYRGAAQARGIGLTADHDARSDAASLTVQTDPRRVRQILDNLLTNALKYTPANGAVRLSLGVVSPGSEAQITVSDTGPGIPEDMRARVFDEFFRLRGHELDVRPDAAPGTGVGLAISRRLARLLGGDLVVGSAPEGGAAFTLSLPLRHSAGSRPD